MCTCYMLLLDMYSVFVYVSVHIGTNFFSPCVKEILPPIYLGVADEVDVPSFLDPVGAPSRYTSAEFEDIISTIPYYEHDKKV
jgi:hypothetical protein